ncbi:MAG TPA: FxsA family protein, partial [Longimicrobiales bacterium]|nr:FxsA family protein [Longimicrobiales bacterium]
MLFLLFVLVPLIELALLIQVGQWIGASPTILLVLFTGISGAWLARREGLRAIRRVQRDMAEQ